MMMQWRNSEPSKRLKWGNNIMSILQVHGSYYSYFWRWINKAKDRRQNKYTTNKSNSMLWGDKVKKRIKRIIYKTTVKNHKYES